MPQIRLTDALRLEYQQLFDSCQVLPAKAGEVEAIVNNLLRRRARYESVGGPLGIPWQVVAVIHSLECSLDFQKHLHNGDPLNARTRHVPPGRPKAGAPPFTWEESALDALRLKKLDEVEDWTIPGALYCLEGYNGWGYRHYHPEVKSPYLWSYSNQYLRGKYISDGTWSDSAVSKQAGAATLLRRMAERGEFDVESHPTDADVTRAMARKPALFTYAPTRVTPGGRELQRFLNTFPDVFLKEDGKLGPRTSDACALIFGRYLEGDPRG